MPPEGNGQAMFLTPNYVLVEFTKVSESRLNETMACLVRQFVEDIRCEVRLQSEVKCISEQTC